MPLLRYPQTISQTTSYAPYNKNKINTKIKILDSWQRARGKFDLDEPLKTFIAFIRMDTGCTVDEIENTLFGYHQLMSSETYNVCSTA
tara:strand:+ start:726 stop:989 length:264 start_codon:yes stop_codon:yes gene_type:complete